MRSCTAVAAEVVVVLLTEVKKLCKSVQNSKICLSKHHTLTEQVGRMCRWSLYSLKELIVLQLP